jgi:hypothetical protein
MAAWERRFSDYGVVFLQAPVNPSNNRPLARIYFTAKAAAAAEVVWYLGICFGGIPRRFQALSRLRVEIMCPSGRVVFSMG